MSDVEKRKDKSRVVEIIAIIVSICSLALSVYSITNVMDFEDGLSDFEKTLSDGFATVSFDISLSNYSGVVIAVVGESGVGNCFIVAGQSFNNSYSPDSYTISVWYYTPDTRQEHRDAFDVGSCDFSGFRDPDSVDTVTLIANSTYHINLWR